MRHSLSSPSHIVSVANEESGRGRGLSCLDWPAGHAEHVSVVFDLNSFAAQSQSVAAKLASEQPVTLEQVAGVTVKPGIVHVLGHARQVATPPSPITP
eukprot:4551606-Prymnesium_polylepis.1